MSDGFSLHAFAQMFTGHLLSSLAGGTILAIVAWIALRLVGRQNSRTRFAVWFAALVGIAALPLLGSWEAAAAAGRNSALLQLPERWALYLFAIWACVAGFGLGRIALGLWQLRRLRARCRAVDPEILDARIRTTLDEFSRTHPVTLCVSGEVRVPAAIGFRKPAVILPAWCLEDLGPEELHAVVLHELQHLRRRDDWTNLLQRVVGALFFFHPAVWWLERRLTLEREMACDDAVLAATANPRAYARCLVSLAEKTCLQRGLAMAQAVVSRVQQMTARVSHILAADRPAHSTSWKPAACLVAIIAALGGASVSVSPQLMAFQDRSPSAPMVAMQEQSRPTVQPAAAAHSRETASVQMVQANWKPPANHPKPAKLSAHHAHAPLWVRTAVRPAANLPPLTAVRAVSAAPVQLLLFVVRTQQQDASGVVWNVSVVRWVVYHPPAAHATAAGVPTKT